HGARIREPSLDRTGCRNVRRQLRSIGRADSRDLHVEVERSDGGQSRGYGKSEVSIRIDTNRGHLVIAIDSGDRVGRQIVRLRGQGSNYLGRAVNEAWDQ